MPIRRPDSFRPVVVALGVVLALLLLGAPGTPQAAGAAFHVYGCKTPSGGVAPTAGWSSSTSLPSGFGGTTDSCPQGGGMQAYLQGDIAHAVGEQAQWAFHPPAGLRLVGATLWRTGTAVGSATNATAQVYLAAPAAGFASVNVFAQCTVAFGCTSVGDGSYGRSGQNMVVVPPQFVRDDGGIYAVAGCGGSAGAACPATGPGNKAMIAIGASDIELDDPAPPTINATSGSLVVGGTLAGVVNMTVQASDVGTGVYALGLDVDRRSVAEARFPDSSGRCTPAQDPGDGHPAFLWTVPCPPNGSATLQIDTRTIPDGPHDLSVYVQDAAGNRSTVGSATTIIKNTGGIGPGDPVSLRGEPNGSPVTDQGRLSAAFLRRIPKRCAKRRYRRKHPKGCSRRVLAIRRNYSGKAKDRVSGRLRTPDGAPIVGARISVVRAPRHGGGAPREVASARTTVTGRWETRVRRRMSAGVRVQWMARVKDTIPVAQVTLSERVRARSSLRIAPRSIHHGQTLRLRGMLLGRSGVKKGVAILVQANAGRRWRAVTTLRARRSGGWRARYKIPRQLFGRYRLRVVLKPGPSYPYASGQSRVVHLRVH